MHKKPDKNATKNQSPKVTSQCKYCVHYRGKKRGCALSYCDFEDDSSSKPISKRAR